MTRLTRVELRRLFARRLTLIGIAALLAVAAALLAGTWRDARPLPAAEEHQAQVMYDQAQREWQLNGAKHIQQCREEWKTLPEPRPALEGFCNLNGPTRDQFGKPPAVFTQVMPNLLVAASYLLAFAAFVIGASFVGAEFSTGAIGNWLTFEPRRLRVYGSKLLAATIGLAPVAAVALAALVAGTWLIVGHFGDTTGTTGKVWADLAGTAGRTVALAAVAGAAGSVVALLLRHTAAAIGFAMAYLVLVEGVFAGFLNEAQPWLVRLNFDAWIAHGTTYYVDNCQSGPEGGYNCTSIEKTLSFAHGAWYLGIAVVVLLVGGGLVFRRRDVT